MVALTATATSKLRAQVALTLGMTDELVVSLSPCKANIMYSVRSMTTVADTFLPMVEKLRTTVSVMRTVQSCTNYSKIASHYNSLNLPDRPIYQISAWWICT